jgi:alcohol dehydrogenase (cytochrome c)
MTRRPASCSGRSIRYRRTQGNGKFAAYDSSNGKELWNFHAGAGVNAPPSTYMIARKQYIVVGAGGNTQIDFRRGNNIIAFSLD